ncbi:hypothetical protein PENTCL1PPCAC_28929 [Pristionchus entomophagus]|uniref:Ethylmalonyl-CoA decarboxylase n=1 Tax=Pristionchus entomophagus TaxID=358040 RepID=A0AAV5UI76_9BILA|nr:hypothetical protein PENTCL1PPCAC_28929 [Pristionchus entomophagus]
MNTPGLILRLASHRQVTPAAFIHKHIQVISQLSSKYEKDDAKEKWLKEQGDGGSVSYARNGSNNDLGLVTFHHKQKLNAFTGAMMHDFSVAVREAVKDEKTRCVVVRGENGNFCSGGELNFVERIASEEGSFVMNTVMMTALKKLANSEKVSIAVLEGSTMGGASEIASACDIRVAHRKSKVGFVQGKMGVCPGWGGGRYLLKTLGTARAMEYLATAALVRAEELYKIGYVTHLFDSEAELTEYLKRFSRLESKNAFVAAKRMVANYSGKTRNPKEKEEEERRIFMSVWGHADHKKSIQAIRDNLTRAKKEKKDKK